MAESGHFLTSADADQIYSLIEIHREKFPDTPERMRFAFILQNAGTHLVGFRCIEGEWEGLSDEFRYVGEGDPRCPNGHPVKRNIPLRLSWSQKEFEAVPDSETNCDVWLRVDFGHGPVEVRCTQTGEHTTHGCSVMFSKED